jgi:hypothetical protein
LNRSATNIASRWRMASIAYDVALILLQARTPRGWDFRERQNAGELQHVVAPDGGL